MRYHIKGGENLNFAIPINDVIPIIGLCPSAVVVPFPDEPEAVTNEQTTGPSLADTLQWMVKSSATAGDTEFKKHILLSQLRRIFPHLYKG